MTKLFQVVEEMVVNGKVNVQTVKGIIRKGNYTEKDFIALYRHLQSKGIEIIDTPIVKEHSENKEKSLEASAGVSDSVKIYLKEISKIPLLTASEELHYAKLSKQGDTEATKKLIESNLRLVVSIAKRYLNSGMSFLDLIQEGNMGLIKNAKDFDWEKNNKFSTFATWWIRQAIGRAIQNQSRTVRVPVHMIETLSSLNKAKKQLEQENGYKPTDAQLAKFMNLTVEKVKEIELTTQNAISLDKQMNDEDEDSSLGNLILDEKAVSPETMAIHQDMKNRIMVILDSLKEREKQIMILRYGLNDEEPMTLEQVGKVFDLTRERIRQIEAKVLKTLKKDSRIQAFAS